MEKRMIAGVEVTLRGSQMNYSLPKGFSGEAFKEWKLLNQRQLEEMRGVPLVVRELDELEEEVLALTDYVSG